MVLVEQILQLIDLTQCETVKESNTDRFAKHLGTLEVWKRDQSVYQRKEVRCSEVTL